MAKKTKQIETPIDQRETFVSIQKTFAESGLSVAEKLQILYALQKADTQIDKIIMERGQLPMEVKALENEIADLTAKITRIEESIQEINHFISACKINASESEALIEKYNSQLNNITNSREYDSLRKEIENTELEKQIAQKNINEAKEKIAKKEDDLEAVKATLAVKQEDLKAKQEELDTIVEATAAEEAKLRKEREVFAEKIDARTMSAYERIRESSNNHLAVATVFNGNACGGCFNSIAPQRLIDINANKKMIICEFCGRILVNPENE